MASAAYQQQPQQRDHLVDDDESVHGGTECCATYDEEEAAAMHPTGSTRLGDQPAYIRMDFIKKVYAILCVQLLLTVVIAFPFQGISQQWLIEHVWLFKTAQYGSLALVIGMVCCCQEAARKFPHNYLLLLALTVAEGVIIGFVTAMYKTESVLLAAGLTTGIFVALTLYACVSKSDFTGAGPYLFVALNCMLLWGLIMMFFPMGNTMMKVYAGCGALLFSFYIVYDTQLIVGGRHSKHQFSVDDYAFAALNLYLDIINLFLYLLSLFGDRR